MMHTKSLIIGLAAVLVVALIVGAFYLIPTTRNAMGQWFTFMTAPGEVKNLSFLTSGIQGQLELSEISFGTLHTMSYPGFSFEEAVHTGDVVIAIMKDTITEKVDIYAIEKGDKRPLTSDGRQKQNLTLSPDGTRLAFSYVNPSTLSADSLPEGVTLDTLFDVSRYELAVLDLSSATVTSEGNGVYPHFIDDQTLFYVSAKGLVSNDLLGGNISVLADPIASRMNSGPIFLTSDTFALQNGTTPQFDVFKLSYINPLRIEFVKTLPSLDGNVYNVSADGKTGVLYGLFQDTSGRIGIMRADINGTKNNFFMFPETMVPVAITN